ncbi:TolB family protein [Mangrovibacterium lignilyticum]|uniref:TolB family protein n=1 Tax=Mangrovibacterium lignilyticum TaxID=2668052 RepID=UPI0013D45F2A|nr:hypothetical protein [Mangrovibacterium lignilyticum]
MIRIKLTALFLLFVLYFPVQAQYFSTGSDPGKIVWRQIVSENFQIIFPDDYESQAKKLAAMLEKVYEHGYISLESPPRKISVVLHTHTINSNGMVAWSPKRMELYPTPNQRIYAQDWIEQLAVHEFRHVVQMDKIEQELPGIFKVIFGEQAAAAVVGAYLPFWFLEGDAVISETALTKTGRGRDPNFLMENKAQLLQKGVYSYDKATLGSYKDFVPNRYKFGWWFAGGIRQKYGSQIWSDVLNHVARSPLSVNPVNSVLKKQTGKNKEALYKDLFQEYKSEWQGELERLKFSPHVNLIKKEDRIVNYLYLSIVGDEQLVAYKQSRDDVGRIISFDNGREVTLFTPGTILSESFSGRGHKLIWSERRPDIRWTHADYSVVVVFDQATMTKCEFRPDSKLFSPVISPSMNSFAAVSVDNQNHYQLQIRDLKRGILVDEFSMPQNDFVMSPTWSEDGQSLYFIALNSQGKYFGQLDLVDSQFKQLTAPVLYDIRNLSCKNNQLFYTSAETGIDNIFCLDLKDNSIKQLTSVEFGADYAVASDHALFFSDYSANGYQLAKLSSSDFLNIPVTGKVMLSNPLADSLAKQEAVVLNLSEDDQADYRSKPYRKLAHLFNFHSWAPAYINLNDYEVRPGVSLFSQNKLGTATTNLGYEYDMSERTGKVKANFEYTGLFPVLDGEVNYGKRKSRYRIIQENGDTITNTFSWNELSYELGVRVPLKFSEGKYSQLIRPEIRYNFTQISHDQTTPDEFYQGFYHAVNYRLYFQNVLRSAELDIIPRLAQVVDVAYKHSPNGGTGIGDLKALQTYLYFPGIWRNQGIRIYNGFQKKNTDLDISFSDVVRFPRGIQRISNTDLYTLGADYVMPLWYPDLSLSRLFFLKRLRTSLFYDFSSLKGYTYNEDGSVHSIYKKYLTSVGLELTGDGHFLRLPAPVSLGLRSIYLPDFEEFRFEVLFSISFDAI